jgi:hypothetical protein
VITIKKVDMSIETAYQLNELGFAITLDNETIQIEKED